MAPAPQLCCTVLFRPPLNCTARQTTKQMYHEVQQHLIVAQQGAARENTIRFSLGSKKIASIGPETRPAPNPVIP